MNSTILILIVSSLVVALANAQGPLTPPPGAPAPVMKSLDQVEARTPLVAGQPGVTVDPATKAISISQSGSYYLTGNLATENAPVGISIGASDVTLDLNGFAVIRTTGNGLAAISSNSNKGIWIKNGSIVGGTTQVGGTFTLAGWSIGTDSSQSGAAPARVSDLVVRGTRIYGIALGTSSASMVERCLVDTCGGVGITANTVIDCVVRNAKEDAISTGSSPDGGSVSNCVGVSIGSGFGIKAEGSIVINSKGVAVGGLGIAAATATNCIGTSTSGSGIFVSGNASNCTGTSFSGTGISVDSNATNCSGLSTSGTALVAVNASNCVGYTNSGSHGINVGPGTASYCRGSRPGGVAINAAIAIACTTGGGTISSPQKHLGTP